ncbi:hypothetical protein E3N88_07963 [Mikania micrantha]|uniref:Integrase catalytic domain-containing protein n=1 Tax=Mikania micrantha TaxID=192012 RepID=A0A5N6PFZ4_9ASTR|nr:hypothetical protein E3N88_07963 [Mikania micrantha]
MTLLKNPTQIESTYQAKQVHAQVFQYSPPISHFTQNSNLLPDLSLSSPHSSLLQFTLEICHQMLLIQFSVCLVHRCCNHRFHYDSFWFKAVTTVGLISLFVGSFTGQRVKHVRGIQWIVDDSSEDGKSSHGNKGNQRSSTNHGRGGSTQRGRHGARGGRGAGRGRGDRGSYKSSQETSSHARKPKDKSQVRCYDCLQLGHYASECKAGKKQDPEAHLTKESDEEPTLLLTMAGEEKGKVVSLNEQTVFLQHQDTAEKNKNMWYLDNGASNHMTGVQELFAELDTKVTGSVRFGDGSKVDIKGKGVLLFQCKTGDQLLIPEVYYIPALKSNILSLGQMTVEGYDISMKGEFLKVRDEQERLLMKVERSVNRLYKILLSPARPVCLTSKIDEEAWLWHVRLGHANFQTIEMVSKEGLVEGLPPLTHPKQLCEGCLVSKQTRKNFSKEAKWRAQKPMELIHGDLCGPITPQSIGEGVRRQKTVPYTPQQNGVVERRNRTVMNMTRALLKTRKVPDEFWGEAVTHAVNILNRLPTKSVQGMTPYEKLKGKKPSLSFFKVFGCIAHTVKLKSHVTKLEDRSVALVYLGFEPGTLGFKLYNPKDKRVLFAREGDVVFNEKEAWDWENNLQVDKGNSTYSTIYLTNELTSANGHVLNGRSEGDPQSPHTPAFTSNIMSSAGTKGLNELSQSDFNEAGLESQEAVWPSGHNDVLRSTPDSSSTNIASFDHKPTRLSRSLDDVYKATEPMTETQIKELYSDQLFLIDDEPTSYEEAAVESHWRKAMEEELEAITRNKTWTLVKLPNDQKVIGLKWVFKVKRDATGRVTKHKARLVAKGYVQQKGVDFEDAFAPVARMETIRLLLALAAKGNWVVHHLDVKSAFLNGELKEEVYVSQPSGFEVKGKEYMVYKLQKALYGLRQAPRAWNMKLDKSLKELGFTRCAHEQAVYKVRTSDAILIIGVYVDDLIVTGSSERKIADFKEKMKSIFEMSDLGKLSYYLGIEVDQKQDSILVKQESYALKILSQMGMQKCNEAKWPMDQKLQLTKDESGKDVNATDYRRVIGSLIYLINTRPDLSFSVGVASKFMQSPKESHQNVVKQILRYLKGTVSYGLKYRKGGDGQLVGYSDSSHGTDIEDRRGTTGMAFYLSGNLITWSSQKQKTVALSSCEAEFMAATSAACEALWLRNLVADLTGNEAQKVVLLVDNASAISLMKNPVFHSRSKHIDTKFHFIRECIERGQIEVKHVSGDLQKADMLTKALPRIKFCEMRSLIGIEDLKKGVNTKGEIVD